MADCRLLRFWLAPDSQRERLTYASPMHTIQAYQTGNAYAYDIGSQRETHSGTHGRHIRQDQDRCDPSGGIAN